MANFWESSGGQGWEERQAKAGKNKDRQPKLGLGQVHIFYIQKCL